MTITTSELSGCVGRNAIDATGDKIGQVVDIYLDEETNEPEWLAVKTGFFGSRISFVPLEGASVRGDEVQVRFDASQVKGAPHAEPDGALSQEEEASLYAHYGVHYSEARSDTGLPGGQPASAPTPAPAADDAMTRSEEELEVGKVQREAGRVRLRKWVETERVSQTVPVAHDEVRIEREPITEGNIDQALRGPEISEGVHEIVLTEEEVVANTEVVPKERIRLDKETVTEQEQVEVDLRKERVEVEGNR